MLWLNRKWRTHKWRLRITYCSSRSALTCNGEIARLGGLSLRCRVITWATVQQARNMMLWSRLRSDWLARSRCKIDNRVRLVKRRPLCLVYTTLAFHLLYARVTVKSRLSHSHPAGYSNGHSGYIFSVIYHSCPNTWHKDFVCLYRNIKITYIINYILIQLCSTKLWYRLSVRENNSLYNRYRLKRTSLSIEFDSAAFT